MAAANTDLIWIAYNEWARVWEISKGGSHPKRLQLPGFLSLENSSDREKIDAIIGSWELSVVGPGVWRDRDGGGWVLIRRQEREGL